MLTSRYTPEINSGSGSARTSIAVLDSADSKLFKTVCSELSNRNAREILRAVGAGLSTSTEIVERTKLSLQNVLLHIHRLEKIGFLVTDGHLRQLKGRSPRAYRISHCAILLVPSEITNEKQLDELRSEAKGSN